MATTEVNLLELADALRETFPAVLHGHLGDIVRALRADIPATWDDETPYVTAWQPEAIGEVLIRALHEHLVNRRIGYLYRKSIKSRDRVLLGKASKVGGKLEHFAELDFLIEINWETWGTLNAKERVALIDHELCHFGVDEEKNVLLAHDVEEFGAIVRRWGLWTPDLCRFTQQVMASQQRDLFVDQEA